MKGKNGQKLNKTDCNQMKLWPTKNLRFYLIRRVYFFKWYFFEMVFIVLGCCFWSSCFLRLRRLCLQAKAASKLPLMAFWMPKNSCKIHLNEIKPKYKIISIWDDPKGATMKEIQTQRERDQYIPETEWRRW